MKSKGSQLLAKILIVEDQSTDIAAPYYLTTHLGCAVTLAFDGEQALDESNREDFDLIILDWNLPLLNGQEFLKTLEHRAQLHPQNRRKFQIILHSGENLNPDDFQGHQGFEVIDIWQKPMSATEMMKKLKRIQEKRGEQWKI